MKNIKTKHELSKKFLYLLILFAQTAKKLKIICFALLFMFVHYNLTIMYEQRESVITYVRNMSSLSVACYVNDYERVMRKIHKNNACNIVDGNGMCPILYASKYSSEKIFNEVLNNTDFSIIHEYIRTITFNLLFNDNIDHNNINLIELCDFIDHDMLYFIIKWFSKHFHFERSEYKNEWMKNEKYIIRLMKMYYEYNNGDICDIYAYAINILTCTYKNYDLTKDISIYSSANIHLNITELLYSISTTFFKFTRDHSIDNTTMMEKYVNWYNSYKIPINVQAKLYCSEKEKQRCSYNEMIKNIKTKHELLEKFFIYIASYD
jgi:hypothetical protein